MADRFLDMATDALVPVLSGTHSIVPAPPYMIIHWSVELVDLTRPYTVLFIINALGAWNFP